MSERTALLQATPFHARAVEMNRLNAWENRGGFTLASHYGFAAEEAVAARISAAVADISWHWRVELTGDEVGAFVARFFTRNVAALGVGAAMDVLWLNDAGAVRGAGTVLRCDTHRFRLVAAEDDREWLEGAAKLYGVTVRYLSDGVLALIGPAATKILAAAGLDGDVLPLRAAEQFWRGLTVQVSRLGLGYEIAAAADDAVIVWDRLMAAGCGFALVPAGQRALDLLEFESGLMRPGRDWHSNRDGFSPEPSVRSLGLSALVDRAHLFNGRAGVLAAGPDTGLSGVLFDGDAAMANTPLTMDGRVIGRTLSALTLPVLMQGAAFAVIEKTGGKLMCGDLACRPVDLPFLPVPAPLAATESAAPAV